MGGEVFALAFGQDNSLYAGGRFTSAGGQAANCIARWDQPSSSWRSVAIGNGMDYSVLALTVGPGGALYAGGDFTTAGATVTNGIARWDGVAWRPLGDGITEDYASVNALAFAPDGSLYAGGWFTTAGGVAVNHIARWDGAAWHPLGSGRDFSVYALATGLDGSLYAGGDFVTAGNQALADIARWDGATWHSLGSGMEGDYPRVYALAVGPNGALYAGGTFTTTAGVVVNCIARWNGMAWNPLGSGMGGVDYPSVSALSFGPDGSLYAGGSFTTAGGVEADRVARWDGTTWHPLSSGMDNTVFALAFGPDGSLYAGGDFTTAGGVAANQIARWDGAAWHPLGSGVDSGVGTLSEPSWLAGAALCTQGAGSPRPAANRRRASPNGWARRAIGLCCPWCSGLTNVTR